MRPRQEERSSEDVDRGNMPATNVGMAPDAAPSLDVATSQRILSVDVLRGFDMFWIVGGGTFVGAVLQWCGGSVERVLLPQLEHAEWAGFRFLDLVFPLFVFLVGMSAVFSLEKILAERGKGAAYSRLVRRAALIFLLGIVYSGGLSHRWPDIRLLGVLQRIALCYLFTGMAVIHLRPRGIVVAIVTLLAGYWAWLTFVPLPGVGAGAFAPGKNWPNYLDSLYLIGRRYDGQWDPEGLLSTLPAIGTCLLGVLASRLLTNRSISETAKLGCLIGGGILSLALGYAWGLQFPVIKKIWTSSFVLVAGGYSLILLGVFHAVIDVWRLQRWALPFVWIGTNAITIYMLRNIVDFDRLARRLVGGDIYAAAGGLVGNLLVAAVSLGLTLAVARFLYKRKIFLRL
jgi:predicted acyltransferase